MFAQPIYLFLVLSPIVYWLGQTVPLITHFFDKKLHVGNISGRALFLSTIGSFLGAISTTLIFFNYFGVASTIVINCMLLIGLTGYLSLLESRLLGTWLFLLAALLIIYYANIPVEQTLFNKTNNYGNYRVKQYSDFSRILQINESNSSYINANQEGFPYIELVRQIVFKQLQQVVFHSLLCKVKKI
jgi:hypothetical protein